ncbi:unnamed protein product [Moneuplotes crassus]|uniref:Uncharacterized protein n=1 Tax=Euplotes crassus TaxID=5936 RepID=A0AAD1XGN1_EUPCR|nr:unnamed protein product [Moneuplotes crassus]
MNASARFLLTLFVKRHFWFYWLCCSLSKSFWQRLCGFGSFCHFCCFRCFCFYATSFANRVKLRFIRDFSRNHKLYLPQYCFDCTWFTIYYIFNVIPMYLIIDPFEHFFIKHCPVVILISSGTHCRIIVQLHIFRKVVMYNFCHKDTIREISGNIFI